MKKILCELLLVFGMTTSLFALDSSEIRNPGEGPAAHQLSDPTETIARVPAFTTDSRIDKLMFYPCTNCHTKGVVEPNPKVRSLKDMHTEVKLSHGGGRFWCLTCHGEKDRNHLVSLKGQPISFDQSYLLCGQCHFARQKDFFRGAHGKRKGSWRGEKRLTNCTECHNPHAPSIPQRLPRSAPVTRMGQKIVPTKEHGLAKVWEKKAKAEHKHKSQERKP